MTRRLAAVAATVTMAVGGCTSGGGMVTIGSGLRGPVGLRATVYAGGLAHVSTLAFDAAGRLWVATADSTDHGQDGVYLVAKAGAAPVQILAGLHTPLGLLWYQESLYVASAGRVDAYSTLDGTRFTSHRSVVTLPAAVGESNELVLAPNGRMQMGISAPCDHCVPSSKFSAAVVSFRPDGSDLRVDVSRIRAPVGLTYYRSDLFVTINQRDDLGAHTPGDWLSVVAPGQDWGYPDCYGQTAPACAGVPLPTAVLDKHAAVSGVAVVTGQLGPKIGTSALVAEWATGKVERVALQRVGSTYVGMVTPFLTGIRNPVPVLLSPDGALLVGDWATGAIYRISGR